MPSTASPKKKTSPLVWVGVAAVVVVALTMLGGGDAPPTVASTKTKKTSSAKPSDLFLPEDATAKFPALAMTASNAFNPLLKKPIKLASLPKPTAGIGGIDPALTGGQGVWYYTGVVELDGKRQALLENPTTGEAEYVNSGDAWKKTHIGSIDVSTVVLVGPDGKRYDVPIQQYGVIPGQAPARDVEPKGGAQPLNVPPGAIAGAIGAAPNPTLAVRPAAGMATMTLPNGTTMQVPYDANSATDAGTGQTGNGRRRGRRNRNNGNGNNPGDFNNAP